MSQWDHNDNFILLPELKLLSIWSPGRYRNHYKVKKESEFEVCPKCATPSKTVHDRRWVNVKDQPIRGSGIKLKILKRRFRCPSCRKVFTEPVSGIRKGFRTTERFRRGVRWACENFSDLKRVSRAYGCSSWLVYKVFYEQLALKARQHAHPWPQVIGIDEHSFRRGKYGPEYASIIVDYTHKKIFEVAQGKTAIGLEDQLRWIEGRENVRNVVLDMCDAFKKFAIEHFPNAEVVADKFHVLRLLTPALNARRKEITGDKRSNPVRKLLLRNGHTLKVYERSALNKWLDQNPVIKEVYFYN